MAQCSWANFMMLFGRQRTDDNVPLPPIIRREHYTKFCELEKQIDGLFRARQSILDEATNIENNLRNNISVVYGISRGIRAVGILSCLNALRGALLMSCVLLLRLLVSFTVA